MSTITLFEHQAVPFAWNDRDLGAIERLNRALGTQVLRPTVRGTARALAAAQHVGVVRLSHGRTVEILPKIHAAIAGGDEAERQARANLLHLLAYAGDLPIREHEVARLARERSDWFEILTRLFATRLAEQWERGPHRAYRPVEEDLPVLKGTWRIADQLRRPASRHVFAVTHDAFTADTPLNRVFRFVVERLFKLTRDADNRQRLGELRQWMDEVALVPHLRAADASPALITRLTARFTPLLNLARLFLDESTLRMEAGAAETFAFVFDMNAVFEAFVVNFIRRHREEILPTELQVCELLPQTCGATLHLATNGRRNVFRLKPDLGLRANGRFVALVDAKYKVLKPNGDDGGVSQADFYQMYAYANRYACPTVLMLYPSPEAEYDHHFSIQGAGSAKVIVATINLAAAMGGIQGKWALMRRMRMLFKRDGENGQRTVLEDRARE